MIFRSNYSSFISFLYAVVVVAIVINPVAYGQDYNAGTCRPAVGDYATCSFGEGDPWNIKSDCEGVGVNDGQNILGCCPGNIIAGWDDLVVDGCSHCSDLFPETTISKASTDTITEEDIGDLDIGIDSTAAATNAADSSSSSSFLSSVMGITISFVVMIGHYY
jgi:hypothetical protein